MPKETVLVVLPIAKAQGINDAFESTMQHCKSLRKEQVTPFPNNKEGVMRATGYEMPGFKVGTLDELIEVSDELAKVDQAMESTLDKLFQTGEQLCGEADAAGERGGYGGGDDIGKAWPPLVETDIQDASSASNFKHVDCEKFLKIFHWNKMRHTNVRMPLKELVGSLHSITQSQEEETRKLVQSYGEAKAKLALAEKKATGSLAHRDIGDVIRKWKDQMSGQLGSSPEMRSMWDKVVENKKDASGRWDNASMSAVPGIGALFVVVPKTQVEEFKNGYAQWGRFIERAKNQSGGQSDKEIYDTWVKETGGYKPGKCRRGRSVSCSISQLELFTASGTLIDLAGASASAQHASHLNGFTPFLEGDTGLPANVLTNSDKTFFDANFKDADKGGVVIDLGTPQQIGDYRFRTNLGEPSCDPCSWKLQGWKDLCGPSKKVTFAPKAGAGATTTLDLVKSLSEKECMTQLAQQLRVPKGKKVVLSDDGGECQLYWDDVEDGEKLFYEIQSGEGKYSEKKAAAGTWVTIAAEEEQADNVTKTRKEYSNKYKVQSMEKFSKVRFHADVTRGSADFGPLPYVPFAAVPGSASRVLSSGQEDSELWACLVFKQKQADFTEACKMHKMTVRTFEEQGFEQPAADAQKKTPEQEYQDALSSKNEKLLTTRKRINTSFSSAFSAWIHLKMVRGFVEAIHRYGLNPDLEGSQTDYVGLLFNWNSASEEQSARRALLDACRQKPMADRVQERTDADEDAGALQESFPYVSLQIKNILDRS